MERYGQEEGLPQLQVWDLLQDERGYLWMALYSGGIARFDGQQFRSLTVRNGLPSNNAKVVYEDREGILWFGTEGGLVRHNGDSLRTFTTEDGLPQNDIRAIAEGPEGPVSMLSPNSNGTLWASTTEGLFSHEEGSFEQVPGTEDLTEVLRRSSPRF